MNRFMMMAVAVGMLAAGGYGAERDAAKEAPIDWPARAATVKVGMTVEEVEKILPRWKSPTIHQLSGPAVLGSGENCLGIDEYQVGEDWLVRASYFSYASEDKQKMRLTSLCINKITRPSDDRKVWLAKAASIKAGMTRAEVERNLPVWAFVQIGWTPKTEARHEVYWFTDDWPRRFQGSGATWALTIDYERRHGSGDADRVIQPVKIEVFEKPYPQIPFEKPFSRMPMP
jgi:hypothetical protein